MKHASTSPFRPRVRSMLALACAALLAGCTVGPDFRRPDPPMAKGYAPSALPLDTVSAPVPGGDAQRFAPGRDIQADWWTLFGSPRLDALIARALARSPTLEAAQAALRAAQENVYAQRGFFYPTVGIGYSPARTKIAGNLGGNSPGVQGNGSVISTYQGTPASEGGSAPFNAPVIYNFHTAQLTVGYAPDIFGGQRRQLESLEAQARMQHYQLEAAYLTLASNLVAASIQEALLRRQLAIAEGIVEANEQAVALLQRQLRAGYAARQDLAQQELALAQARQQLPPLRKQREQTRNLLRALAGDGPDEDLAIDFDLDALVLPRELPLALPSRLVEQRPDIRAAEEQLHAASAQVGVAVADRLPQFSIDASWGGAASRLGEMFLKSGRFFSLAGSVGQTLFDGGTLEHRQRAAEEGLRQADAQYRATVIAALQNVADTLQSIQANAQSLQDAALAEEKARVALDLTRRRLRLGDVDRLALLNAQQAHDQAVLARVQAQAARLGDSAALFQASGGGWWQRAPKS